MTATIPKVRGGEASFAEPRKDVSSGCSQEHEGERDGTFQRTNRAAFSSNDFFNIFFS